MSHEHDRMARPPWAVLQPSDDFWPPLWREMPDPPPEIHVSGDPQGLLVPGVAIVGTRRATVRGMAFARALAAALANHGFTIVSGLARGVDAAAHRGALDVGGATVAVLGTGIDRTYPQEHEDLRRDLEERGCCLSEFPPGTPPRKHHFPLRNRLLAGLVQGVVVVEAPRPSGALVTAYAALDYDREVFAVPGPVELNSSRGCHHLLREGAHLVESVQDVLAVLGPPRVKTRSTCRELVLPAKGSAARWIFDRLDFEGCAAEELRERWPGRADAWAEGLLALEMAELIKRLPGGILARSIW